MMVTKTYNELKAVFDAQLERLKKDFDTDVRASLVLEVGPEHAETLLNQMFTCFRIGYDLGQQDILK